MDNHIFIICSPLQLRITSIIIKSISQGKFHAIYLKSKDRLEEYIQKDLDMIFDSFFIAKMNHSIINLMRINAYLKKINTINFIYLANANDLTSQYIVSMCNKKINIRTFDDGILNINSLENIDTNPKDKKRIKYLLSKLIYKNKYSIKRIIDESSLHFTILNNNRNINVKSKILKLNLFENNIIDNENITSTKIKYIFVGSKFKDILAEKNENNLLSLISKINNLHSLFDDLIYLRHPRESIVNTFHMNEIKINSISEDYIQKLLQQGEKVNIIGFASTCQLNLMNLRNVELTLLKTNLIRKDILSSFSLFDRDENVSVLDID